MAKQITQREAIKTAFLNMCQQYSAIGEQLKTMSALLSPYIQGQQDMIPELKIELYSPGEAAIMRDAEDAKGMTHGTQPPPIRPIEN